MNRFKVMKALIWLKKHNQLYKDKTINESHLSWMKRSTEDLRNIVEIISIAEEDTKEQGR